MAPYIFSKNIIEGKEIIVFNEGNIERDLTYIDDIVNGLFGLLDFNSDRINNYEIYNIGNSDPINLMDFIHELESKLNKKAIIKFLPLREGDVLKTYSSTEKLSSDYHYQPKTNVKEGISHFVDWYRDYFKK